MCGIIAGISLNPIVETTLSQLKRLEYRGYDSSGLAVIHNGQVAHQKNLGDTAQLNIPKPWRQASIAIAHTRWATHGEPSEQNAHPHVLDDQFAVIHNGIIENHAELRKKHGFTFTSKTDSEIIVHLYKHFLLNESSTPIKAWENTIAQLEGSWATVLLDKTHPQKLLLACNKSPMVLGRNTDSIFVSSDLYGLENIANEILYVPNHTITDIYIDTDLSINEACWEPTPKNLIQEKIIHTETTMLHEIMEQPDVLAACSKTPATDIPKPDQIIIAACGSSYHVGLLAAQCIESHAQIPCRIFLASELRYASISWPPNTALLTLSQSGETADTLECVRHWKRHAGFSIAICNVKNSALMRLCDYGVHTPAGIEVAVAATKSVTAAMYMVTKLAQTWGSTKKIFFDHPTLEHQIQAILSLDSVISYVAEKIGHHKHLFLLGRGLFFPVMLEAALKIKEICYIHTEAFASGEMKHGPLALIEKGSMVIIIAARDHHFLKSIASAEEIVARGGHVLLLTDSEIDQKPAMTTIKVPFLIDNNSVISLSIFFQLVSLKLSIQLGYNPDRPRNLAKCVTVE